jgi:hypothetical protein
VMLSRGHYDHPAIRSRSCKPREQVGQCWMLMQALIARRLGDFLRLY